MGRTGRYNYQVQIEEPGTGRQLIEGAMRYEEAKQMLLEEAKRIESNVGYIWPQTKMARKKMDRDGHRGCDYLKIEIEINTPEIKRYRISGVTL